VGRADSFREGRVYLADELAAVRALIDVAGGRATLCGHSSGCAIALRAAAENQPVDRLVLFEAPLDPAATGVPEWTAELYRLLDAGDRSSAVSHYMKDIPLEVLDGLRESPLWAPFVAHAESLLDDRPGAQREDGLPVLLRAAGTGHAGADPGPVPPFPQPRQEPQEWGPQTSRSGCSRTRTMAEWHSAGHRDRPDLPTDAR
jgi:pimeloyl-ACP methyl ester carboxylesterase